VTLQEAHEAWAWVMIIGNAAAGLWALGAHRFEAARTRALWWFTGAAEATVFVQVALGVAMVVGQDRQPPDFHMFYGFVALFAIGIIYSYRAEMATWRYLLYGFGGLFIAGLGIRAMIVGGR
jgi:hypothetical protein